MNTKTQSRDPIASPRQGVHRAVPGATTAAGGFFLAMGGIHVGIVAADVETYRHFADNAIFDFVRTGWAEVFMANPTTWALLLAAGEIILGVLLLRGGTPARIGWVGIIAFQILLMLFGWGFWSWSLPAILVLCLGMRRDWEHLG